MWPFRKRNRRQAIKAAPIDAETIALALAKRKQVLRLVAMGLAGVCAIWIVTMLLDRPIRRVEVSGHFLRVSPLQVEQAVMAFTKADVNAARGFVSLHLDKLKQSIEQIAWVDSARIERRWPDGVRVHITEQTAGARWGEHGLLNARGELFLKEARYMPPELPQLNGPDGTEAQVADLYLKTYPRLAGVGLRLSRVTLDARGAWELTVTSTQDTSAVTGGIVVRLGRQEVNERLDRFVTAASPLISARATEIKYVDMRYSNGFAVGWTNPNTRLAEKTIMKGSLTNG